MKIKQIDGRVIDIMLMTKEETDHFNEPTNYTKEILAEWGTEPFKDIITKQDRIVLDIGANIGLFALHILPYADKIICVEPTPEHMVIQKSLLDDPIVLHEQSALHNYTGKCRFRREGVNTTMNAIRDSSDAYEVNCITLKDLCDKYGLKHVDLCKVDIEGGEFLALTKQTVSEVSGIIKKFILETHPRSRQSQDWFKEVFEFCGYWCDYLDFNGSLIAYK